MIRFAQPVEVPLAVACSWKQDSDWLYEEKKDGFRAFLECGQLFGRSCTYPLPGILPASLITTSLDGELCGSVLFVFDVLRDATGCLRHQPLAERRRRLLDLPLAPWMRLIPSTRGNGGEYLEAVLANGGEGVVAKRISAPYGVDWFKAKRLETFDVTVSEVGTSSSVAVTYQGKPAGRVPVMKLDAWESIRVGSVIEIAAHSRHKSGKFREPRFLRVRSDKVSES